MYLNPRVSHLSRRVFLHRLGRIAAAAAMLPATLDRAHADPVERDDARLETGYLEYGGVRSYVARPRNIAGKIPVVLVIHDDRGLRPYIEDVARRVAREGFHAVAPDLLAPAGGTPQDEERARQMIGALDRDQTVTNLVAVVDDLAQWPNVGRVGCIGFAWGGGMASELAVHSPRIAAASSFYGAVPDALDVPRIKARLLLHCAERDERFESALKAAGVAYAIYVYGDTDPAGLAWSRTMTFLKDALR